MIYSRPIVAIFFVKRRGKKASPDEGEQEESQVVGESSAQAAGEEGGETGEQPQYVLEGEASLAEGAQDAADDVEIDYDAAKDIVDDVAADGVTLEQDVQNAGDDQAS